MNRRTRQRGLVLVSSLLLLLVVTMLALAMFRSMGLAEKIAGNVREKQRALHAAVVAEQYAEFWLSSSGNSSQAPVTCNATASALTTPVLICNPGSALSNPASLPWTTLGGASVGYTYYPASGSAQMYLAANTAQGSNTYIYAPSFYIQYVGIAEDGGGSVYKIDAVGYGGSALSVAVVESMYEIGSGVNNLGGL
ncbi:MAG TPA: PilX N-terminal domain-containing pilus assembly protein [Steroidobacteraceae bacterium]|jgi:type IV pilus assembly protein PilX|nr:PilX N-terminal domain-containing pilus assembly protein [Steroidobacteraceae bacterium]